jgi:demethylmenaquinone methyltransferase/2-methoxy-6-polyprenyl-1,4-benzoquinol methylase
MIRSLNLSRSGGGLLDVACGTCDVAMEAFRQYGEKLRIVATDFSFGMLVLGQEKIRKDGSDTAISLVSGNALGLPFPSGRFDAVTIAFGIRNIGDKKKALEEFRRCLKKGGVVAVLELTTPENRFLHTLYMMYFMKVLPFIGGFFSKNRSAYQYLPESVVKFPDSPTFGKIMESAGFSSVVWKKMTFGIVTLFTGVNNG